jgi:hypothetical protein
MQNWEANLGGATVQIVGRIGWQRCNIGRQIGRSNRAELGGLTVSNWQVQLGRIGGRNGAILGEWLLRSDRCNVAILGGQLGEETMLNWQVQGCKLEGANYATLAGELGGATVQIGRSHGTELGGSTVPYWEANCKVQPCRICKCNGAELGGATVQY